MLLKAQAAGDLVRVWAFAQTQGIELQYLGIPEDFDPGGQDAFDPQAMRRLYDLGREMGRSPDSWNDDRPHVDGP